jgi:TolB protein
MRAGSIMFLAIGLVLSLSCGFKRVGQFSNHADIGKVLHEGKAFYQPEGDRYKISGSGANMWGTFDAFHYVWKEMSGDAVLSAKVEWENSEGNPHKKAGWMIRQSNDPDAAYVDFMVHGNGLVSLQYRLKKGDMTQEIQAPYSSPEELVLERQANVYTLSTSRSQGSFEIVGSVQVALSDPVSVGLAVCSHDSNRVETAIFTKVLLQNSGTIPDSQRKIESYLEILDVKTGERNIIYQISDHIEAPNWSPDGSYLMFNSHGKLFLIPDTGGFPQEIPSGVANRCNNDHGLSPDGRWIAVSSEHANNTSLIYLLPAMGGKPRLVTPAGPSFWHGWSPDAQFLAYCAQRNNEYDVYTIPVQGGEEKRLTTAEGLDDGPEYSPDGRYIYFNSARTGLMKIWRMKNDGRDQEQVTIDADYADWFPHVSPDGRWIAFLSYDKTVQGHPANQVVSIRLMPVEGGETKVIARLFGGQGTMNVPSWNPASNKIAIVSYRLINAMQ